MCARSEPSSKSIPNYYTERLRVKRDTPTYICTAQEITSEKLNVQPTNWLMLLRALRFLQYIHASKA